MSDKQTVTIELTAEEARYIIASGIALAQHVPEASLPTYCGFSKSQIIDFSVRMREELEAHGLDM